MRCPYCARKMKILAQKVSLASSRISFICEHCNRIWKEQVWKEDEEEPNWFLENQWKCSVD